MKFWIDDLEYFDGVAEGKHSDGRGFYAGLGLAVLSWIPWLLAGLNVKQLELSALFMFIVIAFSMLWIIATWIDQRPYEEQVGWAFYNPIYAAGFLVIWQRDASWIPLQDHGEYFTYAVLSLMLIVFLVDLSSSRTLSALARKHED